MRDGPGKPEDPRPEVPEDRGREESRSASPDWYLYRNPYGVLLPILNPAQHRLLDRHVQKAIETLEEADRLLKGLVAKEVGHCVQEIRTVMDGIDREEANLVGFDLDGIPQHLVPYLDNPFAQGLAFNLFCAREGLSHTRGAKAWQGGNGAVSARNLPFLPPVYADLWEEGVLDKTRLIAIANRNLTRRAYDDLADMARTRRKEDLDERLLKLPPEYLQAGRRGPTEAVQTAEDHGWMERFERVQIAEDLVQEAKANAEEETDGGDEDEEETPVEQAVRQLRAGLGGAEVPTEVRDAMKLSPDPVKLVEKFLIAHRKSGDPDPDEITKTLFFAHAGPIQRLEADDKFLLRHFRPVKTQKRGQLFYRLLEVIEEALLERSHLSDLGARGITEEEAQQAVRQVVEDLNQDPNRYLEVPTEWLGEVTRRHLYFGSRTRKEGAAYKWFRRIGEGYFLGSHKTREEMAEREERRAAKAAQAAD